MSTSNQRPVQILLVEDSPSDVAMTRAALREGRIANEIQVVDDGEKALDFLRRRGDYASAPRPDLILLDLNLPRMDGREVLAEMDLDPALRVIPVVVLTSSKSDIDIIEAYRLRANSYVNKPIDIDDFFATIRRIEEFWFQVVSLPRGTGS